MNAKGVSATEETGATPVASPTNEGEAKDAGRPFLSRRNLTEEEAASPAGMRWLQHDAERLDREAVGLKADYKELRERYEELKEQLTDKRVEVEALKGASQISLRNEVLAYLTLSVGSAGLGAAPAFLGVPEALPLAIVVLILAAILVGAGVFLRVRK